MVLIRYSYDLDWAIANTWGEEPCRSRGLEAMKVRIDKATDSFQEVTIFFHQTVDLTLGFESGHPYIVLFLYLSIDIDCI